MSSNQELLRTTSLKGLTAAQTSATGFVEAYPRIIEIIRKQCGADVATLFAEPAMPAKPEPGNLQVTWYTPLDGQMLDLASIDEVARRPVITRLRDRLDRLKPALNDPEIGPTVASWLYIPSPHDLLSVGGNPVLINWGFVPSEIAASPTRREAHFIDTIGRYAPDLPIPPFTVQEAASYGASARTPAPASPSVQTNLVNVESAGTGGEPTSIANDAPRFRGWAPLIASLIAALVLLVLLIPGILIFPTQADRQNIRRQEDLLREDNNGLAERLRELESAAGQRVCRLPNGQLTPIAPLPGQENKPIAPAPRADLLPPSPDRVQIPPSANAPANAPISLTQLADSAVVFIIGKTPGGIGMGSGFFVAPDRIVTNRHVIEHLEPGTILVTNKLMQRAVPAKVVGRSPSDLAGTGHVLDLAILAVEQPGKGTLKLGPSIQKGAAITAAGYPGYIIEDDPAFKRLIEGDLSAAPDNVIRIGAVIQKRDSDPVKLVTHSADLGRGNSGGPLMDMCGRVVGINTSVRNEGLLASQANFAQDVKELEHFLGENGVTPDLDERETQCPPAVAAATPPAGAPPPASPGTPTQPPPAAQRAN